MDDHWLEERMEGILDRRSKKGSLRVYLDDAKSERSSSNRKIGMDFSSNDYLGLAREIRQQAKVEERYQSLLQGQRAAPSLGSTGSRLLSGDSNFARQLERRLATWHNRPAALLFNSGYDANLSVLSCLPCDQFVFDEYAHNSLRMGMRLASMRSTKDDKMKDPPKQHISFQHNSVDDLRRKLQLIQSQKHIKANIKRTHCRTLVIVESVYSMDGDVAPLPSILEVAMQYGALVLVDEAHGLGIFGDDHGSKSRGVGVLAQLYLEKHPALACSVHTFGKAAGAHGAVVCGSQILRQYLWNYGWPLVYSTSLPLHSLVAIECSYETMTSSRGKTLRQHTQYLVSLFRKLVEQRILSGQSRNGQQQLYLLPSMSPIQALVLPCNGNQACTEFCDRVWRHSNETMRLFPIKSPTVPVGMERIRIILHGHNNPGEVQRLVDCMSQSLVDMDLVVDSRRSKL